MNPIELVQFVESQIQGEHAQLQALAAMAEAPAEDYVPQMRLPVQNEIPAFKLGDGGLGSVLANRNHGVAGPMLGQETAAPPTLGELLVGEIE